VLTGTNGIAQKRVLDDAGVKLPQLYSSSAELQLGLQELQQKVIDVYRHSGYYFAHIDSVVLTSRGIDSTSVAASIYLTEGREYRIGRIAISGASVLDSGVIRSRLSQSARDILDEEALKRDIDDLLSRYEELGYPFAKVDLSAITPIALDSSHGELLVRLTVDEGVRAHIGRIIVRGNTSTTEDVIRRELRIPIGSYYDRLALSRARSRLERLGFFEQVGEPELYEMDDSTVAISITVKEGNTTTIDGILGYNPPRSSKEKGFVTGLVDLVFGNIAGTGRRGSINYVKEETRTNLEVRYLEPWILNYPVNVEASYAQQEQDTTYVRSTIAGDARWMLSEDVSVAALISMEKITPTVLPDVLPTTFDSRQITTGLSGQYDSRDNLFAPTSGLFGSFSANYGTKQIFGPLQLIDSATPASVGIRTVSLQTSGYFQLGGPRFIGAVDVKASTVSAHGSSLEISDLFRLGGIRSIRGYREGELLVSRYAIFRLEPRYMTGRLSYLFAFLDAGYLVRDAVRNDETEQAAQPLSYGLGLQLESPLGLLSVSIALAKSVPIDQAKIHLGVVKQF
jgi:outer membrane protein assembly factor BamA